MKTNSFLIVPKHDSYEIELYESSDERYLWVFQIIRTTIAESKASDDSSGQDEIWNMEY